CIRDRARTAPQPLPTAPSAPQSLSPSVPQPLMGMMRQFVVLPEQVTRLGAPMDMPSSPDGDLGTHG
ncbi:hypothetical protein, partial [Streptomyces resistomycificus]|uniref:hypothetical protein n=1 Tax=Streptomyces resistomycificus TaxID=67356 RepID=UPI001ADF9F83